MQGAQDEPTVVADALGLPLEFDGQSHKRGLDAAGVPITDSGGPVDPVDQERAFARDVGGVDAQVEVGAEAQVGDDSDDVARADLGHDVVYAFGPGGGVLHGEVELTDSEKESEVKRLLVKARKVGRLPVGKRGTQ